MRFRRYNKYERRNRGREKLAERSIRMLCALERLLAINERQGASLCEIANHIKARHPEILAEFEVLPE